MSDIEKLGTRFWSKVDTSGECWIWLAATNGRGYGRYRVDSGFYQSHRLAYSELNGPIPAGLHVDHICHNTLCVRPEHLRAVTNKQNSENHQGPTKSNTSGVRGVYWYPSRNKWRAMVSDQRKRIHVGYFDRIEQAEAAVIATRNEVFTHNDFDRRAA